MSKNGTGSSGQCGKAKMAAPQSTERHEDDGTPQVKVALQPRPSSRSISKIKSKNHLTAAQKNAPAAR